MKIFISHQTIPEIFRMEIYLMIFDGIRKNLGSINGNTTEKEIDKMISDYLEILKEYNSANFIGNKKNLELEKTIRYLIDRIDDLLKIAYFHIC